MNNDRLFAIATIVVVAGVIIFSLLHYVMIGRRVRAAGPVGGEATVRRLGLIERASYVFLALTLIALAVSGMAPALLYGKALSGLMLMGHVGAGGAFMFFLLLVALLGSGAAAGPDAKFAPSQCWTFWATLVLGVGTALTMMFSMVPIFGPHGLEVLRDAHRYCGLVLVAVGYWHVYQTLVVRRGRISWLLSGKVSSDWARHYCPSWQVVEK
jgi:cytochrome b subunit of formate dehydrogenase